MFNLKDSTLRTFIASDKKPTSQGSGSYNKILEQHQVNCIVQFIQSLLTYNIQPSHRVVFNAIIALKRVQNPHKLPSSEQ